MNGEHFKAFLWLRWRLRANQFKRGGTLNSVLFTVLLSMAVMAAVALLFIGFTVGLLAMPELSPAIQMYVWAGVIAVGLLVWMIGLLADLQRTESLALDRFMHLPVSPQGVFLVNYLSSLASLTMLFMVPSMVGLILGQAIKNPWALFLLPVFAGFVFALTAVTYQFQGWLALLMSNPRRRRTIIVAITASFILLAQLPQLFNVLKPWEHNKSVAAEHQQKLQDLGREYAAGKMKADEYTKQVQAQTNEFTQLVEANTQRFTENIERSVYVASLCIPAGWLAASAHDLAQGQPWVALLTTMGFILLGSFSLARAYRTTLRLYAGEAARTNQATRPAGPAIPWQKPLLVERRLPWLSEHASAVATASFRSMSRAPEVKMMLIGPVMMLVMMGTIFGQHAKHIPPEVSPLITFGVAAMMVLITVQLIANQFGYDRTGFRAFVLGPVPRREILLGKNVAIAPFSLGLALLTMLVASILFPMRIDHYPAALMQIVGLYMMSCLLMNIISIYFPMAIALGTMRPAQVKWAPVVIQMLFMFFYPLLIVPLLLPYGIELLLEQLGMIRGIPVSLGLTLPVFVAALWIYRRGISRQGNMLHEREQEVLLSVTTKEE